MRPLVKALIMICALLLTAKLCIGQVQVSLTNVAPIKCDTKPTISGTYAYPASQKLDVEIPKAFVTAANASFIFKNIDTGSATEYKSNAAGTTFTFDNIFNGVDTKILQQTFQLITTNKICYNYLLVIERNSHNRHEKPKPQDPPADFPPPVALPSQCESCVPTERLVIYDFNGFTLKTKWDAADAGDFLYKRRREKLPRVGRDFTFQVRNVNPFRFNIGVADERFDYNVDIPDGLAPAFSLGGVAELLAPAGDSLAIVNPTFDYEKAIDMLGDFVAFQIGEFENTSDCFDPCELVLELNSQIIAYFKKIGYTGSESLEEFLSKKLKLDREPADDDDKELIKKDKAILAAYTKFRRTGQATVSYLIPQVQNVDEYVFQLNITPVEGIKTGNRVLNQEIAVPVLGGFKVDFSTGLFYSKLKYANYSLRSDSTVFGPKKHGGDSVGHYRKQMIQEGSPGGSFGVASLIHAYYRSSKYFNIGASLGAGLKIGQKSNLQYLAGVSALIGRSNRLILTAGAAFGYVDELSNKYNADGSGNIYTSWTDTTVEMKKVLKHDWFFSFTYNIPIGKKTKIVSMNPSTADDGDDKKDDK